MLLLLEAAVWTSPVLVVGWRAGAGYGEGEEAISGPELELEAGPGVADIPCMASRLPSTWVVSLIDAVSWTYVISRAWSPQAHDSRDDLSHNT